jgi:hypothetical protein
VAHKVVPIPPGEVDGFWRDRSNERRIFLNTSAIECGTVQAYRETEYRVHGRGSFTLKVAIACPELVAAHRHHQVDCSAYVTAFNPYSRRLSDKTNAARHAALGRWLHRQRMRAIEGMGQHPSNQWPGEASYLILGLCLKATKRLGARLQQNAIVWSGADAVPQLILLR